MCREAPPQPENWVVILLFALCVLVPIAASWLPRLVAWHLDRRRGTKHLRLTRERFGRWAIRRGMTVRSLGTTTAALGSPVSAVFETGLLSWCTVRVIGTRRCRHVCALGDFEDALDDACERVEWEARRELRELRDAQRPHSPYR